MQLDYPSVIEEMEEMQAIFAAEEKVGEKFEKRIEECNQNTAISTANEVGIARREKILKVIPQDTEDMEERRFRVMTMWNDGYPYTQENLLVRLDGLLGEGNYTLVIVPEEMSLTCLIELEKQGMEAELRKLLEKIVPLNITIDVQIRCNRWSEVKKHTYEEVAEKTWNEMRRDRTLAEE